MAIDLFTIGKFTVHGYGLMIGLGFLVAVLLGAKLASNKGLSADHFTNIAIWVLLIGFLGGKILFLIVDFKYFIANPLIALKSEGFVVYGGIITGIMSIFVYCKVKKLFFADYIDTIATIVPLNQAFGRLGCFCAGCCYGKRTDSWFSVVFPEGCLAPAGVKLLPAQLMMAAGDLIIFAVLVWFGMKKRRAGVTAILYLALYSVGRFIIEFFRDDARGSVGVLSTSQFISIIFGIICLVVFFRLSKKKEEA